MVTGKLWGKSPRLTKVLITVANVNHNTNCTIFDPELTNHICLVLRSVKIHGTQSSVYATQRENFHATQP